MIHICVDKNGIATGEGGDIIFLILLPFGMYNCISYNKKLYWDLLQYIKSVENVHELLILAQDREKEHFRLLLLDDGVYL